MFRKSLFTVVAALAMLFSAAIVTSAQVGELHGHVFMQQADGTKVPLADAVIDVYRTDISSKYNTKTNKKGNGSSPVFPTLVPTLSQSAIRLLSQRGNQALRLVAMWTWY